MPQVIPSKIAGIFKYPEAKPLMKALTPGADLYAEREPSNPYDPNAIAVYIQASVAATNQGGEANGLDCSLPVKVKCGYIPKDLAARLKDVGAIEIKKGLSFDAITIIVA